MEPEGEGEDLPPPYWSSESTACETETARWGDMDEDDNMDFGYTEKPPSSDPPRRPGGDPPGPPGGARQDPLEDVHQVNPRRRTPWRGRSPWTGWARRRPFWRTPWRPRRPTGRG